MTPELLLQKFGYLAVFVGTFLEGETILVMAGFFAERGYLQIPLVILVALTAGTIVAGIIGAVLAVPIAAVGWAIVKTWDAPALTTRPTLA